MCWGSSPVSQEIRVDRTHPAWPGLGPAGAFLSPDFCSGGSARFVPRRVSTGAPRARCRGGAVRSPPCSKPPSAPRLRQPLLLSRVSRVLFSPAFLSQLAALCPRGALPSPAVLLVRTELEMLENEASGLNCRWRLRAQKPSEDQHLARQEFVSKCLSPSYRGQKPRLSLAARLPPSDVL